MLDKRRALALISISISARHWRKCTKVSATTVLVCRVIRVNCDYNQHSQRRTTLALPPVIRAAQSRAAQSLHFSHQTDGRMR